jgi:tetratricopeptide (TPR) repeat protein
LELFWVFVRKGDEKYKSKKYVEAERYYHKVLDRWRKLQIVFDKDDVITKLGIACFEQRKWDQAQSYFNMVPSGNDIMLEKFIRTGNRKLAMHDREAACAHFERALAMPTNLPLQTRRDLHSKAGIAYFQQEEWTDAKKHFLAVADVETDGVLDLRCFEAEHYLAKIHVQENDLDGAEQRCLVASNGRWRILGKSHVSWHESIALLVEIYTAKGDHVEADGYAALLPEGYRSVSFSLLKFMTTIANTNSSIKGR